MLNCKMPAIQERTADGDHVDIIHLLSENGAKATILTLGARVLELCFSDGRPMALSFATLEEVEADDAYVGAVVGRVANRIALGTLTRYEDINSEAHLQLNDGKHHIHGGVKAWDKRLFKICDQSKNVVSMEMVSQHGDQGYPSKVHVTVRYELKDDVQLHVSLHTKNVGLQPTITNLTLHPYFDLSGSGGRIKNSVLHYKMKAPKCKQYLVLDEDNIPTGEMAPVVDTRFDFTTERCIHDKTSPFKGYDNFFIANHNESLDGKSQRLAVVTYLGDGRNPPVQLEVLSNQPGFQMYTANGFDGNGKQEFAQFGSIAIEPSGFIDGANNVQFPTIALQKGEIRKQSITYKFSRLEK